MLLHTGYSRDVYDRFISALDGWLASLQMQWPERVTFGRVDGKVSSRDQIHVWGANADNWNLCEPLEPILKEHSPAYLLKDTKSFQNHL